MRVAHSSEDMLDLYASSEEGFKIGNITRGTKTVRITNGLQSQCGRSETPLPVFSITVQDITGALVCSVQLISRRCCELHNRWQFRAAKITS
jgi:hypothetical protein